MTGPLAPLFAHLHGVLSYARSTDLALGGISDEEYDEAVGALSSIERHVRDMEKALAQADYVADLAEDWPGATDKPLQAAVREYRHDRAALPAREKEEE